MKPSFFLANPTKVLIVDTSTIINLNATGRAAQIIKALPSRLVIEQTITEELEFGRLRGRSDADITERLVADGVIEIVRLATGGLGHFEVLTVGAAVDTLDDGEAATIAYALEASAIPVIDERKAHRICRERFPALRLVSTMDLLMHPSVEKALGLSELADAVFQSLISARMRVFTDHIDWVVNLIGLERASRCPSLPRNVRERFGQR
jgi:predicted nucleic acid-binding protein